jgi:hypothetical protein
MKKTLFCLAITIFGIVNLNAQEFRVGVHGGIPLSNLNTDYALALDVSYLIPVSDKVDLGLTTGFIHSFGSHYILDVISNPTMSFWDEELSILPVSFSSRFSIFKNISLGIDLGYAIPLKKSYLDEGFYYAPRAEYNVSKDINVVLGYRVAKLDYLGTSTVSPDMLSLGIEFKL